MARAAMTRRDTTAALAYQMRALDCHAHLFAVTLTIAKPKVDQIVSLPVWIPGSYLVREFAKHLQRLQATQNGRAVALTQRDKCSWKVHCKADKTLILRYEIYAFDNSVRTAWLDSQRGFFNGTSVCLRVHGQETAAHQLTLPANGWPTVWQVATALPAQKVTKAGFGDYLAANYGELVDSPVELGAFWSGQFTACGVPHRFVVAGAPASFDGARLLADAKAICETEINFWHASAAGKKVKPAKAPHDRYVFLLNAVDNGYGGLEHRHSTALICKRADLPRSGQAKALSVSDGYTTLLGLISHEYFHTWNVKRLRPAEFARYDYAQENYTELLWFFEGFTSYYDDLLLRRAGLIDDATYLSLLGKTINTVQQTPGRRVQSVAQASFDAWVKYYRQDENSANATVSYYSLGSLVALCLDLSLRHAGQAGQTSLDDVMRGLWQRCGGGPMTEGDVLAVVSALGGDALVKRLVQWVHGNDDLPLKPLFKRQGIAYEQTVAPLPDQLGLRVTEAGGIRVKSVLRDGAAEQAGLAAGDEWLGVQVGSGKNTQGWRLAKLDDLPLYLGRAKRFAALVARNQRLLTLPVTLPATVQQVKLSVRDSALASAWLSNETLQLK